MSSKILAVLVVVVVAASAHAQTQNVEEDLTVIQNWMLYSDLENGLYHHFRSQAFELLDARARAVAAIDTESEWRARQESVREAIAEAMGQFPEKTPLNARVHRDAPKKKTATASRRSSMNLSHRFSSPQHSSCPEALTRPAPAILYCSGHYQDAFRSPAYQTMILNLVRKGFVVLAFDPIGQGERLQYLDPTTAESARREPNARALVSRRATVYLGKSARAVDDVGRDPRYRLSGEPQGSRRRADWRHRTLRWRHADSVHRGRRRSGSRRGAGSVHHQFQEAAVLARPSRRGAESVPRHRARFGSRGLSRSARSQADISRGNDERLLQHHRNPRNILGSKAGRTQRWAPRTPFN